MTSSTTESRSRAARAGDGGLDARLEAALAALRRADLRESYAESRCADLEVAATDEGRRIEETLAQSRRERQSALKRLDKLTAEAARLRTDAKPDQRAQQRLATITDQIDAAREASERRTDALNDLLRPPERRSRFRRDDAEAATGRRRPGRRTALAIAAVALAAGATGVVVSSSGDGSDDARPTPRSALPAADAAPREPAAPSVPRCRPDADAGASAPVVCGTRSSVLTIVASRRPLVLDGLAARVMSSRIAGTDVIVIVRLRNTGTVSADVVATARPHLTVAGVPVEVNLPETRLSPPEATRRVALRFPLEPAQLEALRAGAGADLALRPAESLTAPDGRKRLGVIRLRPS